MAVTPNSIITPQGPRSAAIVAAFLANVVFTPLGVTNTLALATVGPNGGRVTRLRASPTATVAGPVQLQAFRSLDVGVNKFLGALAAAGAYTLTGATAVPFIDFGFSDGNPWMLAANEAIFVGVGSASSWSWLVEWSDY